MMTWEMVHNPRVYFDLRAFISVMTDQSTLWEACAKVSSPNYNPNITRSSLESIRLSGGK